MLKTFENSGAFVLSIAQQVYQYRTSTTTKQILNEAITAFPWLKEVLVTDLNPLITTSIGEKTIKQIMQTVEKLEKETTNSITKYEFRENWQTFLAIMTDLQQGHLSGGRMIMSVAAFLNSCDEYAQLAYIRLFKKELFKGIGAKFVNNFFGYEVVPQWNVQLCNTYNPKKNYRTSHWFASRKLNGIRCTWINGNLFSRSGKALHTTGFAQLLEDLRRLSEITGLEFFDGELYVPNTPFQQISSLVRNGCMAESKKEHILFNVFCGDTLRGRSFANAEEMVTALDDGYHELIATTSAASSSSQHIRQLRLLDQIKIENDPQTILHHCQMFTQEGFEGIVLRHPEEYFNMKRSNALLKYKLFKECDLEIVGFEEGVNKFENSLGALVCAGVIDGEKIETKVGTGFDDLTRERIWRSREQYLNRVAEIKYQELTELNSANVRSLAFPVFLKFKD